MIEKTRPSRVASSIAYDANSQSFVARFRLNKLGKPRGLNAKVDKPGTGNFWRLQKIFILEIGDNVRRDVSRRFSELLSKRHREVCLKIAKFRILTRTNQTEIRFGLDANRGKSLRETIRNNFNHVHNEASP